MMQHAIAGCWFCRCCSSRECVAVCRSRRAGALGVHIATASISMVYNEIQGNNAGEILSDPVGDFRQGLGIQKAEVDKLIQFKGGVDRDPSNCGDGLWPIEGRFPDDLEFIGHKYQPRLWAQNDTTNSARWIDVANVDVPGRTSGYLDVQTFLQVSGNMYGRIRHADG